MVVTHDTYDHGRGGALSLAWTLAWLLCTLSHTQQAAGLSSLLTISPGPATRSSRSQLGLSSVSVHGLSGERAELSEAENVK